MCASLFIIFICAVCLSRFLAVFLSLILSSSPPQVRHFLPALAHLIYSHDDVTVTGVMCILSPCYRLPLLQMYLHRLFPFHPSSLFLSSFVNQDGLWAATYLSDGGPLHIQMVIEAGMCRRLVELLLYVHLYPIILILCPLSPIT